MSDALTHQTVLLDEAVQGLNIHASGCYVDGTFGRGGHSRLILEQLDADGHLLAFDKDPQAIATAEKEFSQDSRFSIAQASFAELEAVANQYGWVGDVDGVLLDLGVSSPQVDDAARGFSFQNDGPLDMRMDPAQGLSAAQWLADADEKDIARVLKEYGEERFAKRIARAIINAREETPIQTTKQLASIVAAANPKWEKGKDPSTRSFQAIRIFINSELDDLEQCLQQAVNILKPGGRLVVISFHSLEDRIVKRFIRAMEKGKQLPIDLPVMHVQVNSKLRRIGKAIKASPEEIKRNARSRSAIMRIAERV